RLDIPGLDAVREFLARTLAIGPQLILPLHGAPALLSDQAVPARQEINRHPAARDLRERTGRERPGRDARPRGDPRGHRDGLHAPRRATTATVTGRVVTGSPGA